MEDKNIRKEFEDNVIWIVEWKIKSLESISKFHETLDNTFSNKFTGDVRADDPWWRLNDDSSYNAYPLGIFDIWVPNQNELYADEKEVILSLMKAQIETYLFTGPDEAARFSGHNRLPGFQHALALVERAVSEITDPQVRTNISRHISPVNDNYLILWCIYIIIFVERNGKVVSTDDFPACQKDGIVAENTGGMVK